MVTPQIRRSLLILERLKEGRYPNCASLARECETSTKTIQRDIEALKIHDNAPIEYDEAHHGYYLTEKTYELPAARLSLSEGDLFAIYLADKVLGQYAGTPLHTQLQQVFNRIVGLLPSTQKPYTTDMLAGAISVRPEPQRPIDPETWQAVFKTLGAHRQLRLFYRKPGETKDQRRTVEPCHVLPYRGDWYLLAWCTTRAAYRLFAFSRMQKVEPLRKTFAPHADLNVKEYLENQYGIFFSDRQYAVRLLFSRAQAPYIAERSWHPQQALKPRTDGRLELSFPTCHLFEVTRWVLSWGADVQVLAPGELKEAVRRQIEAMARQAGMLPEH